MIKKDYSLSKRVYDYIVNQLKTGKFKPGGKITEMFIANQVGISRGPVREAFKQLARDRLIHFIPRSGCYLADLDLEEVVEIYEIRKRLESLAMELGFHNYDCKEFVKLRNKFESVRPNICEDSLDQALKYDRALHDLIVHHSNADNIIGFLETLQVKIDIFRWRGKYYIDRIEPALREHLGILDAIINRDKHKAIEKLTDHLEQSRINIIKHFYNSQNEDKMIEEKVVSV